MSSNASAMVLWIVLAALMPSCGGAKPPIGGNATSPSPAATTTTTPTTTLAALSGTWVGRLSEDVSYQICLELPADSQRPGSVRYFDGLSCSGVVHYEGAVQTTHIFLETLTVGNETSGGNCADTGRIEVRIAADGSLQWQWFQPDSATPQVVGVLTRQASCSEESRPNVSGAKGK